MFFILSKILLFLLNPFNWILICIVFVFVAKKAIVKKRLLVASAIIFILFSNYYLFSVCVRAWQPKIEHPTYKETFSTAIMLNGMTMGDRNGDSYFGAASDRFLQTARLYKTGVVQKILISGGDGSLLQDKPKEAFFLQKEFIALGIPDSALIVESNSRNTYESAVAAKQILDSLHLASPYILVSSATHIPRSMLTFKKVGLNIIAHPANYEVVDSKLSFTDYILPNLGVLPRWKMFLKEVVGTVVYRVSGKA